MANTTTLSVAYASQITVTETFNGYVSPVNNTLLINGINQSGTLNSTTTPPATLQTQFTLTMSGGTGTIDLTALPGLNSSETVDGTGLKMQLLMFSNPTGNANKVTVAKGGSNGYGLDASGDSWSVPISPGQSIMFIGDGAAPTIGSGAKTFDVTGTGSQQLDIGIVMG